MWLEKNTGLLLVPGVYLKTFPEACKADDLVEWNRDCLV